MSKKIVNAIETAVFGHRKLILLFCLLITLFLGYQMLSLHIDAGFEKLLPLNHEYIQTFLKHQDEFGGANRLLIAVRAEDGNIFTPVFFGILKKVTDAVFFLPGVNRSTVQSIYTPNVRFIEIVEGGFTGGNVIPADFQPTPERLAEVRENILKSGTVGRLVANDFSAAMVSAQLVEIDPATGERLDYLRVAELLETEIRDVYQGEGITVHIIGFAKIMGDISEGATGVVAFFGIAFLITAFLVYFFTRSARLTFLALLCSLVAVIWNLGLLTWLGFGIDPMSLLVPFLVFAIGVSHGVQMVNAMRTEYLLGHDSLTSARNAFRRLFVPGEIDFNETLASAVEMRLGDRFFAERGDQALLKKALRRHAGWLDSAHACDALAARLGELYDRAESMGERELLAARSAVFAKSVPRLRAVRLLSAESGAEALNNAVLLAWYRYRRRAPEFEALFERYPSIDAALSELERRIERDPDPWAALASAAGGE